MDRAGVSIEDAVALIISVKKINRAQETGWIFYVTSKLIFGVLKLRPYMKKKWTDPSVNCWWTVSQQLAVYQQTADSVLINENMSYLKVASCCKHHFFMVVFIVNHCCSFLSLNPQSWVQEFSRNTLLTLAHSTLKQVHHTNCLILWLNQYTGLRICNNKWESVVSF